MGHHLLIYFLYMEMLYLILECFKCFIFIVLFQNLETDYRFGALVYIPYKTTDTKLTDLQVGYFLCMITKFGNIWMYMLYMLFYRDVQGFLNLYLMLMYVGWKDWCSSQYSKTLLLFVLGQILKILWNFLYIFSKLVAKSIIGSLIPSKLSLLCLRVSATTNICLYLELS